MSHRRLLAVLAIPLLLTACATQPDKSAQTSTIILATDENGQPEYNADDRKISDAMQAIQSGKAMQAIEGPLTEIIDAYEARYAGNQTRYYCATTMAESVLYAAGFNSKSDLVRKRRPITVLGPTWARAYWTRGYALSELGHFDEARVDLGKALALSPIDSQYTSELAYTYIRQGDWNRALSLYESAGADADISALDSQVAHLKCVALRGQGYALVELHRLDAATKAYNDCLALKPGEPKSLGELEYIAELRAKHPK